MRNMGMVYIYRIWRGFLFMSYTLGKTPEMDLSRGR